MKIENIKYDSFEEFFMDTLPTGELGKKLVWITPFGTSQIHAEKMQLIEFYKSADKNGLKVPHIESIREFYVIPILVTVLPLIGDSNSKSIRCGFIDSPFHHT